LEEIALSDIKQKLKEFKAKIYSSRKRYNALEPYFNPPLPYERPEPSEEDLIPREIMSEEEIEKWEAELAEWEANGGKEKYEAMIAGSEASERNENICKIITPTLL